MNDVKEKSTQRSSNDKEESSKDNKNVVETFNDRTINNDKDDDTGGGIDNDAADSGNDDIDGEISNRQSSDEYDYDYADYGDYDEDIDYENNALVRSACESANIDKNTFEFLRRYRPFELPNSDHPLRQLFSFKDYLDKCKNDIIKDDKCGNGKVILENTIDHELLSIFDTAVDNIKKCINDEILKLETASLQIDRFKHKIYLSTHIDVLDQLNDEVTNELNKIQNEYNNGKFVIESLDQEDSKNVEKVSNVDNSDDDAADDDDDGDADGADGVDNDDDKKENELKTKKKSRIFYV